METAALLAELRNKGKLSQSKLAKFTKRQSSAGTRFSAPAAAHCWGPYVFSTRNKNSLFGNSASRTHSFVHRMPAITFFR